MSTLNDPSMSVPNTSLLPPDEQSPSPAVDLMQRVVRGAHDTIDRAAGGAEPTVRQIGAHLSSAEDALRLKADRLRETGDAWAEGLRGTVRGSPLTCIAVALALGALLGRVSR